MQQGIHNKNKVSFYFHFFKSKFFKVEQEVCQDADENNVSGEQCKGEVSKVCKPVTREICKQKEAEICQDMPSERVVEKCQLQDRKVCNEDKTSSCQPLLR